MLSRRRCRGARGGRHRRSVIAARLEAGDVGEDAGGRRASPRRWPARIWSPARAFTGRCNLFAAGARRSRVVDAARLDRINLVDEAITVATLPRLRAGRAAADGGDGQDHPLRRARGAVVERCMAIAARGRPADRASPRSGRCRVGADPDAAARHQGQRARQDRRDHARARSPPLGSELERDAVAATTTEAPLTDAIADARPPAAELILVLGASAIADRRDVIPAAIERGAAARSSISACRSIPAICCCSAGSARRRCMGLPGCARSPKLNGFDWVLQRLAAGLPVTRARHHARWAPAAC